MPELREIVKFSHVRTKPKVRHWGWSESKLPPEILEEEDPYTPAFLRKSAETLDWKRVDEHSLRKER